MKSKVIQKHRNSRSEWISAGHLVQSPEVTEDSSGLSPANFKVTSETETLHALSAPQLHHLHCEKKIFNVNFPCCNFAFFNYLLQKTEKSLHHLL